MKQTEESYKQAVESIANGEIDVLSFDFFDTLFWRSVASPRDVFLHLGRNLHQQGVLTKETSVELFAYAREVAERKARIGHALPSGAMEVTLAEIYACFTGSLITCDIQELIALEQQCELELCTFNDSLLNLLQLGLDHCERIIVVSDTYHDATFLKMLIDQQLPPAMAASMEVFASSEYRTPKPLQLFQRVGEKLGLEFCNMLHVGDNPVSDIEVPGRLGVRTLFYSRLEYQNPQIFAQEQHERRRLNNAGLLRQDYGLSWFRGTGLKIHEEKSAQAGNEFFFRSYGFTFLGPLFVSYVYWLAEQNEARQVPMLYLMRDGWIFSRIAERLHGDARGSHFWLNRYTATRAAIFHDNRQSLERHLAGSIGTPLGEVARQLWLKAEDLLPFGGSEEPLMSEMVARLAAFIYTSGLQQRVCVDAGAFRKRLLNHLQSCMAKSGASGSSEIALCDLGYNLTTQLCLQEILDQESLDYRLTGLYLITLQGALEALSPRHSAKGYLIHLGLPGTLARVFERCSGVLDNFCAIPEGMVIDYTDNGDPICEPPRLDAGQLREAELIQAGVLDFADTWKGNPKRPVEHAECDHVGQLLAIFQRILVEPTDREIACFSKWRHELNFGSSRVTSMIDLQNITDYFSQQGKDRIDISDLLAIPYQVQPWLFGLSKSLDGGLHQEARRAFSL